MWSVKPINIFVRTFIRSPPFRPSFPPPFRLPFPSFPSPCCTPQDTILIQSAMGEKLGQMFQFMGMFFSGFVVGFYYR